MFSDNVLSLATLDQNSTTSVGKIHLYQSRTNGVNLRFRNVGPADSGDGQPYPVTIIGEVYNS